MHGKKLNQQSTIGVNIVNIAKWFKTLLLPILLVAGLIIISGSTVLAQECNFETCDCEVLNDNLCEGEATEEPQPPVVETPQPETSEQPPGVTFRAHVVDSDVAEMCWMISDEDGAYNFVVSDNELVRSPVENLSADKVRFNELIGQSEEDVSYSDIVFDVSVFDETPVVGPQAEDVLPVNCKTGEVAADWIQVYEWGNRQFHPELDAQYLG